LGAIRNLCALSGTVSYARCNNNSDHNKPKSTERVALQAAGFADGWRLCRALRTSARQSESPAARFDGE
jgi:hypothetical protein